MLISRIITLAFAVIVGLFFLVYFLIGFAKGWKKMLVRFAFLCVSILIAVILTKFITSLFEPQITALIDNIQNEMIEEIKDASPSLVSYIYSIATAVVAPLVFLILFFIISALMHIPGALINKVINATPKVDGVKVPPSGVSRLIGIVGGIMCAFLVAGCVCMPFWGYMAVGADVYADVKEEEIISDNPQVDSVFVQINDANKSLLIKSGSKVTKVLFDRVAVVETSTTTSSTLTEEINTLSVVIKDGIALSKIDFSDVTKIDMTIFDEIIDDIATSPHLKKIIAEILVDASTKWTNGKPFLGVEISSVVPDDLSSAVNIILKDFTTTDDTKVINDIKNLSATVGSVLGIYECIGDLNVDDVSNLDLKPLKDSIDIVDDSEKLEEILSVVLADAGNKWYQEQDFMGVNIYDKVPVEFKNAIKVVLQEFKDTKKTSVCADLRNFCEAVEVLSGLANNVKSLDFEDYESFNLADLDAIIDDVDSNSLVTEVVAALLKDAGTAWGSEPPQEFFSINIKESLPTAYAHALDANIEDFKNTTKVNCISNLKKFSSTIKAYKYALSLANSSSLEDMGENMSSLISSITPDNVDQIKGAITPEMLVDSGLSESDSQVISDILESTLDSVSELTDEEKAKEAEALNKLFAYATGLTTGGGGGTTEPSSSASSGSATAPSASTSSGASASDSGSTSDETSLSTSQSTQNSSGTSTSSSSSGGGGTSIPAVDEKEVVDSILNSVALSTSVITYAETHTETMSASDSQKEAFMDAIDEYGTLTDHQQQTVDSIKKLFGITE